MVDKDTKKEEENMEIKNNFLESVTIGKKGDEKTSFPPFEAGTQIDFGGEQEVQNLIKYYLGKKFPEKSEEEIKDNAERFKVNCVVANNGGGKSRFFTYFDLKYKKDEKYKIILDDFMFFSPLKNDSIHRDSFNGRYNNMYCTIFKLLNDKKFNDFFIEFLNLDSDFTYKIDFSLKGPSIDDNRYRGIKIERKFILNEKSLTNLFNLLNDSLALDMYKKDSYIFGVFLLIIYELIINFFMLNSYTVIDNSLFKQYNSIIEILNKINNFKLINKELIKEYGINLTNLTNLIKEGIGTNKNSSEVEKEVLKFIPYFTIFDIEKRVEVKKCYGGLCETILQFLNSYIEFDIEFKSNNDNINILGLSGGEKSMLFRFSSILYSIAKVSNSDFKRFIILIDEPDLHLHLEWQQKYIQKLIDVFSTLNPDIELHFIIATHSPFIISDLPKEGIIVLDKGKNNKFNGEFTEIKKYENKSFGANYVDIIREGFFFENKKLMGSFAEEVIGDIAEEVRTMTLLKGYNFNKDNFKDDDKKLVNMLLKKGGFSEIKDFNELGKILEDFEEKMNFNYEDLQKIEKVRLKEDKKGLDGFEIINYNRNNIGDSFIKENLLYFVKDEDAKS